MKFKASRQFFILSLFVFLTLRMVEIILANDLDIELTRYHDYAAITNYLKALHEKYPQITDLHSIGKTEKGKDIWLFTISRSPNSKNPPKSAICIVGNLEGNHLVGTEQILYTASFVTNNYGKVDSITQLVNMRSLYLIPIVNIDAAQFYFQKPQYEFQTNFSPEDEDDDGLLDEDGPEDINGDGFITQMRLLDSNGEWLPDSTDARFLKKANPLLGQKGIFHIETEGIDNDGDASLNEDPPGGIYLNMNFPYRHPRFKVHAGRYPLSAPETHALVDFMLAHREIALVQIYGFDDNLINLPHRSNKSPIENKKEDSISKQEKKLEELTFDTQDLYFFRAISQKYRQITRINTNLSSQSLSNGFGQWLYFQFGIPAITTRVWWPPQANVINNQMKAGDSTQVDSTQIRKNIHTARISTTKPPGNEELLWLKWIDANQQGQGFIPWQKFKHPTLGEVEIGGFQPFIKSNPPVNLLHGLAQTHNQFSLYLANLIPEIKFSGVNYEKQNESIYLVTARITKVGFLPVKTVFAQEKKLGKPAIIRLNLTSGQLLSGTKQTKLKNLIFDGSEEKIEWLIFSESGTKIILEILSETAGQLRHEIVLN